MCLKHLLLFATCVNVQVHIWKRLHTRQQGWGWWAVKSRKNGQFKEDFLVNFSQERSINSRTAICQLSHKQPTSDNLSPATRCGQYGSSLMLGICVLYHNSDILYQDIQDHSHFKVLTDAPLLLRTEIHWVVVKISPNEMWYPNVICCRWCLCKQTRPDISNMSIVSCSLFPFLTVVVSQWCLPFIWWR